MSGLNISVTDSTWKININNFEDVGGIMEPQWIIFKLLFQIPPNYLTVAESSVLTVSSERISIFSPADPNKQVLKQRRVVLKKDPLTASVRLQPCSSSHDSCFLRTAMLPPAALCPTPMMGTHEKGRLC